MKEAVITLKDGDKDYVSPYVSHMESDTHIIVNNGYYDYTYSRDDVENLQIREYTAEP